MSWLKSQFNTGKPIIDMCHLRALQADFDSVMFLNERGLPYLNRVDWIVTAVCFWPVNFLVEKTANVFLIKL